MTKQKKKKGPARKKKKPTKGKKGTTKRKKSAIKKSKATFVSLLLDESGSMGACWDNTISSFNEYLAGLKKDKKYGKVLFTFTKFEGRNVRIVHDAVKIGDAKKINRDTYTPCGSTPLHDAIGRTVTSMDKALKKLKSKPTPLVIIMTDGHENASSEYNAQSIKALIEDKKAKGWTFMFVGANQDAIQAGGNLGIGAGQSLNYNVANTGTTGGILRSATNRLRKSVVQCSYDPQLNPTSFKCAERRSAVDPDKADDKKVKAKS